MSIIESCQGSVAGASPAYPAILLKLRETSTRRAADRVGQGLHAPRVAQYQHAQIWGSSSVGPERCTVTAKVASSNLVYPAIFKCSRSSIGRAGACEASGWLGSSPPYCATFGVSATGQSHRLRICFSASSNLATPATLRLRISTAFEAVGL